MPITYDITKDGLFLEGRKEGILEERKRKKRELAKRNREIAEKLLKRGMTIEEVKEITSLSVEELTKISEKLKTDEK